jgi:anti-sigma factor RsiW
MPKLKAVEVQRPVTLEDAIEAIEDHYSSCDHESEIRSDVVSEVKEALKRFGLLGAIPNEDARGCHYCGERRLALVHKPYCIHQEKP